MVASYFICLDHFWCTVPREKAHATKADCQIQDFSMRSTKVPANLR